MKKEFLLQGKEFIALCDLLKVTDLCDSGAEAKHIIADGKVIVAGVVDTRKRRKVRAGETVSYNGHEIYVR